MGEKGGGPYGSEVTRGQDLTGRDFSGKSLVKQDFKTVSLSCVTFVDCCMKLIHEVFASSNYSRCITVNT